MAKKILPKEIENVLNDFISNPDFIKLIDTSELKETGYDILNPQLSLKIYKDRDFNLIIDARTNGENGFTELKKTYPIK